MICSFGTSPLMKGYQTRQPFNGNHLRPCPLIDNPQMLYDIVQESGAHSTQLHEKPEDLGQLKDDLKEYSESWGKLADGIWDQRHPKEDEQAG